MYLTVSIAGTGAHPASWQQVDAPLVTSLAAFQRLAKEAERGCLDAIFFDRHPWGPSLARSGLVPTMQLDPLLLITALSASTTGIGLGGALALCGSEPFNIARSFSAIDRLTGGRSAWLTSVAVLDDKRDDLCRDKEVKWSNRYNRAEEAILVAKKLWDSWEDGAIVIDKPAGRYADATKIHRIDHRGQWFTVRGPLNAPRPLQGHPVIVQSDDSPEGLVLASRTADLFVARCSDANELRDVARGLGGRPPLLATITPILAATRAKAQARAAALDAAVTGPLAQAIQHDANGNEPVEAARRLAGIPFIGTPAELFAMMSGMLGNNLCHGFNIAPAVAPIDLLEFVNGAVPLLQASGLLRRAYDSQTLRESLGLARPANQFEAGL